MELNLPKFIWASCEQLYSLAETPQLPLLPFFLFIDSNGLPKFYNFFLILLVQRHDKMYNRHRKTHITQFTDWTTRRVAGKLAVNSQPSRYEAGTAAGAAGAAGVAGISESLLLCSLPRRLEAGSTARAAGSAGVAGVAGES
jgi:hypothetical protein